MQKIVCNNHDLCLEIPVTDEEFQLTHIHESVQRVQEHYEKNPNCKFEEVQE